MPESIATGVSVQQTDGTIRVLASVEVPGTLDTVYRFWRDMENLPRFMGQLEGVTVLDPWRSRWVVQDGAGPPIELHCEIVAEVRDELIAWHCFGGAGKPVDCAIQARFTENTDRGGTFVRIEMVYGEQAPAARLLGDDPSRQVEDDLRRCQAAIAAMAPPSGQNHHHATRRPSED